MDISSSLIAKGTAGALAAAATTAGVVYRDQIFGKSNELTKFDRGLMDFIGYGGDIIFEIKKESETEDFTEADLTFSSTGKTSSLIVKVSVDTSNTEKLIEKKGAGEVEKAKRATLKNLNRSNENVEGTTWTWTCKITFTAEGEVNNKSIHNKNKIFKPSGGGSDGLFDLLKKKVSDESDNSEKQKLREIKKKFIKSCASEREDKEKMKNVQALANNKLESTLTINLKAGSADDPDKQTDVNMLYPGGDKSKRIFKKLFG